MSRSSKKYLESPEKLREDIDYLSKNIGKLEIEKSRLSEKLRNKFERISEDIHYLMKGFEALRKALEKFPENTTP